MMSNKGCKTSRLSSFLRFGGHGKSSERLTQYVEEQKKRVELMTPQPRFTGVPQSE